MSTTANPYARGLFVPLSGTEAPPANAAIVAIGGDKYDMAPYIQAQVELGNYLTQFGASPLNAAALIRTQNLARQLRPAIAQSLQRHPAIRQAIAPMAKGMAAFLQNSQKLIQLRLKTSYRVARAPKILVPICLSIAAGASTTGIQVRNPYLGATGGMTGQYQSAWAITSFRTSNNESGLLSPIRLTDFTLGGHNFVAAALNGLTYSAGGAPATLGWPAAAFAETKRSHWATEVQPWNVIAQHGGGTGFGSVMTETGFFQLGVFNGGTATYVDTYSVYCNATLCGNPYLSRDWTQVDAFRKSFAPLGLQAPLALKLAGDAQSPDWARDAGIPMDDASVGQDNAYVQAARAFKILGSATRNILDNADSFVVGDDFVDPAALGIPLDGDAMYVGD